MIRPPTAAPRVTAWLLAMVLFYAGGVGHWLHPHLHGPAHHLHQVDRGGDHAGWQASHPGQPHHRCAFCAFLAHFVAHQSGAAAAWSLYPAHAGRVLGPACHLVPGLPLGLPGSRSPPSPARFRATSIL